MARINPVTDENAQPEAQELLNGVQKSLGMTPNMMATMAHSPAALGAYLNFGQTLGSGSLDAKLREQLAVAIAGANSCEYCASAHTAIGGMLKVDADELRQNLGGDSADARTAAALRFATTIVERRGFVSDQDLADVRAAGFSERDIVEIVAVVAINVFTNYFNHIAQTENDFPRVEVPAPAGV